MTSTLDSEMVQTRQRGAVAIVLVPGAPSVLRIETVPYEEYTGRLCDCHLLLLFLRFCNKCWQTRLSPGPCPLGTSMVVRPVSIIHLSLA